jgi:hypothetical protein
MSGYARIRRTITVAGVLFLAGCALLSSAAWGAPPTVAITSPSAGATVKGTVTVTATATSAAGDYMSSIAIYDGVNSVGSDSCQSQVTCTASVNWAATGLSGSHSLTARARSGSGETSTSAAVVVNVESPPPTVAVTSPLDGSTVAGSIAIAVSSATDPSQTDYPTGISVFDGVNSLGSVSCQSQQVCEGSVRWNATGLGGVHSLTARVRTNRGLSVTSAPVSVTVSSPRPTVTITSPKAGAALRRKLTVKVAGATDPTQVDYPTGITVYDGTSSIGSISCQGQQSCAGSVVWDARQAKGRHTLTAVIRTNTGRTATSPAVKVGVAARKKPKPSCKLSSFSLKVGSSTRGRCTMSGVPARTRVAIQVRAGKSWQTVVSGKVASGGRFNFTLRGTKRKTFDLWVLVGASSKTTSARRHIGILRFR